MKKHLLIFAAFCATVLISCTPSEILPDTPADNPGEQAVTEMVTLTITARFDDTKAYIDDADGYTWKWADGDKLAVYDSSNNKQVLDLTGGAGTNIATFTSTEVPSGFVPVKGVFPASAAGASADEYTIPAVQTIPAGMSIDPAALVATATTDNGTDFNFTSAVSFLRVNAGNDVARVIIHTNDDAEATMTGASASVTAVAPASGSYWIAVKPAVYHGIRVFTRTATQVSAGTGRYVSGATDLDLITPGQGRKLGTLGATDKGTEVCVIETPAELVTFLAGTTAKDAYVVNDLDLSSQTVTTRASFANTFDGQHHTISHWTSNGVALFNDVTGSLKNLKLASDCSFTPGTLNFGFFARTLSEEGSVINCSNAANITIDLGDGTTQHVFGAIVGRFVKYTTKMIGCSNSGNITISFTTGNSKMATQYFGSMVGMIAGPNGDIRLDNCTNSGHLTLNGVNGTTVNEDYLRNICIGGIFGATGVNAGTKADPDNNVTGVYSGYTKKYGKIKNCHNKGDVSVSWTGGTGGYFKIGGIGGYAEGALDGCVNEGAISFSNSMTAYNAGSSVAGICGVLAGTESINATGCINKGSVTLSGSFSNASSETVNGTEYAYASTLAGCKTPTVGGCFGVVGDNATTIQNCTNEGLISINKGSNSTAVTYAGGIVAYSLVAPTSCTNTNTGNIVFDGGGSTKQIYLAGIVGWLHVKGTVQGCSNSGSITAGNWSNTAYNYLGGILGCYGVTKSTIKNCSNSGNMKSTASCKMRIGGIAAALYGTINTCTNTGNMEATNALGNSEIGGLLGYSRGNISGGSTESSIKVTGSTATGRAGLLCGSIAGTFTVSNITVGGTITADSKVKGGILFGGYDSSDNPAIYTLGASSKPLNIKATANINGTPVVSNPNQISDVVGDTATNAASTTNITFTNVQVI